MFCYKDTQESSGHGLLEPSPTQVETTGRDAALARDSAFDQQTLARNQELALKEDAHDKPLAPAPFARDKVLTPKALPRGKTRDQELAREEVRDSSTLARDRTLVPKAIPRTKGHPPNQEPAPGQARDASALARDQSESDSGDDAVVIGRSARSRVGNQKKEKIQLRSDKSAESSQRTSAVNKKDPPVEILKKSSATKQATEEESAKGKIGDGSEEDSEADGMCDQ